MIFIDTLLVLVVSSPDPTLEKRKGFGDIWALSRFLQAQLSYFCCESQSDCSSMIFMWPCIWLCSNNCTMPDGSLTLYSQWECSSMILHCIACIAMWDWHVIDCIILAWSHAPVQPRNRFNVTRPFPACAGIIWGWVWDYSIGWHKLILAAKCRRRVTAIILAIFVRPPIRPSVCPSIHPNPMMLKWMVRVVWENVRIRGILVYTWRKEL